MTNKIVRNILTALLLAITFLVAAAAITCLVEISINAINGTLTPERVLLLIIVAAAEGGLATLCGAQALELTK